jgi:hypothetical protein
VQVEVSLNFCDFTISCSLKGTKKYTRAAEEITTSKRITDEAKLNQYYNKLHDAEEDSSGVGGTTEVISFGSAAAGAANAAGDNSGGGSIGSSTQALKNSTRCFDELDPNGHYRLDLAIPYERYVAEQLVVAALTDVGQCFRKETLDGKVLL